MPLMALILALGEGGIIVEASEPVIEQVLLFHIQNLQMGLSLPK